MIVLFKDCPELKSLQEGWITTRDAIGMETSEGRFRWVYEESERGITRSLRDYPTLYELVKENLPEMLI